MPGRHRVNTRFGGVNVIASAMALVVVIAGSWFAYRQLAQPRCATQVQLTVAAAPEIAPAIRTAAAAWSADTGDRRVACVRVDVAAMESEPMAAAIASRHGVSLTGVGQPRGDVTIPDIWVPDSVTWLLRLRAAASGFAPTDSKSIARSPVVVAMPEVVAQTVGWPDKKLTFADLLQLITGGADVRTGIVDPTRDASGLSGLLALAGAASAAGAGAEERTAGTLRTLAAGSSALRDDLLARFPRSNDPAAIASQLSAAPLSEEDVIAYNATKPPVELAALYLEPAPLPLDYPYAILPEVDAAKADAAVRLRGALNTPLFRGALATAGLRNADGSAANGFAAPVGAPVVPAAPGGAKAADGAAAAGLDAATIDEVLGTWAAITLPGRLLAVFDISGSMGQRVPTARNATRAQVTREAARQGLGLFDDKWAVGVWVFSTKLRGNQDWQEVVPISPLASQRNRLQQSLSAIVPKEGGGTGLFDTMLAAYKNVQNDWEAGRVNSLVMFTDGENEDDNGLSQAQLVDQLKRAADPKRPVRVVIIGIGASVDQRQLETITSPTGGGVFVTEDPAKIGEIFLKAIASRSVAPR